MKILKKVQFQVRCIALAALGLIALPAQAVQIMHWERVPLPIDLPVGQERLIVIDRNVSVGLPEVIAQESMLRVQSVGGVLYLKASQPFDTQRVQLRDESTGEIILVDLTAKAEASDEQVQIVFNQVAEAGQQLAEASVEPELKAPLPVVLTRYAAQSLYAPSRVIEAVPGINRIATRLPASIPGILPALPVSAKPLAAWSLQGWQATAIELKNQDPSRTFELDPRYLQGQLIAATFIHPSLGSRGSMADTTTLIVITQGPLAENLHLPRIQPTRSL